MRRRTFLSSSISAGLATVVRSGSSAGVKAGDIPRRVLGKTGERLTVIGQAGGRFPNCTFEEAKAVTLRAYELGINYFDTARIYWNGKSEEVYGAVLPPFRKSIFLTTKSPERTKAGAERHLEQSLRALNTDYVDLWQIHQVSEMSEVDQIFAPGGAIEAFEAAKKAGKCRFIGFTGHHDPKVHLAMLQHYDKYDTILMPLHAAEPAYLSFEKDVLPVAVKRGMGIQGMKSTANAKLLRALSVKECLSYALSLPIHCVALGCTTVAQVEEDVRVAQQFQPLGEGEMAQLRARVSSLGGPGLEDWKRSQQAAGTRVYRDGALA
jgi:predicted aldo/keto reductase-like oxidoreductase